jgi:zinc protease
LEELKKDGITTAELERAKNSVIGQRKVAMQDNGQLASMVGLDELYGLGYDYYRSMEAQYRAVTVEEIKQIAAKYFTGKPQATIVVKPGNSEAK